MRLLVNSANQRSMRLSQLQLVGTLCTWKRGCFPARFHLAVE
jgi:hypothetical protein